MFDNTNPMFNPRLDSQDAKPGTLVRTTVFHYDCCGEEVINPGGHTCDPGTRWKRSPR